MESENITAKRKRSGHAPFPRLMKKGSAYYELIIKTLVFITLIATVFFLVTFIVTVGEFYRIHIMQRDIDTTECLWNLL